MKQNQSYAAEFRAEAVRMVLEQRLSQAEVAAMLGDRRDLWPLGSQGQLAGQAVLGCGRCLPRGASG